MSIEKLPVNIKYQSDKDTKKMVPIKQEKQNFIDNFQQLRLMLC